MPQPTHAIACGRSIARGLSQLTAAIALTAVGAAAQVPAQISIAVSATPSVSPPSVTFAWPSDPLATGFTVARRLPGEWTWGTPTTIPGGGSATSWVDTDVQKGERYDYWFRSTGQLPAMNFLTAGVEAAALEHRGTLLLIVDATHAGPLAAKLDRLTQDLIGDGWFVVRHDVLPTDSVTSVKALITADVAADPVNTKAVFLFGHVPVPYSGNFAFDGHPEHAGAWSADVYYGELNGVWTDTTVNTTSAARPENHNTPGDGKFDQSYLPSDVDLIVGRVDLANMPSFASSERQLLSNYLDKDHDYRHGVFTVAQRAVLYDGWQWQEGRAYAASAWRNFEALLGYGNIHVVGLWQYFPALNSPNDTYSWAFACNGGGVDNIDGVGTTVSFTSSANRNVFTMMFGSWFVDWDSTNNFLRAPLCSGWTLTNCWTARPHWSFQPMGLGETIGYCTRYSQNDTDSGGWYPRGIHLALMGDPTLRQHVVKPPTNLVSGASRSAVLSWTPSADAVAGYHIYRAATPQGPFERITRAPITVPQYSDPTPFTGSRSYLVRAVRLETTPSGSYWNLSQGASITLTN